MSRFTLGAGGCALTALLAVSPALAQEEEEKKYGWFNDTELSIVATSGNSESTTLGFANVLKRIWEDAEFRLDLSAIRNESRPLNRFAVGTPADFQVLRPPKSVDAERYYLKAQYGHTISERLFWTTGGDAEQNRPAGIDHRYSLFGGLGNSWFLEKDDLTFRTTYNVSGTEEELSGTGTDSFAGLRLTYFYEHQFTDSTAFNSELVFTENLQKTSDWRYDFYNAVTVTMSKRLALKAGLRLLYRNVPPLESVPLFDSGGNPTGSVLVPKEKLDTNFATSLVIRY